MLTRTAAWGSAVVLQPFDMEDECQTQSPTLSSVMLCMLMPAPSTSLMVLKLLNVEDDESQAQSSPVVDGHGLDVDIAM
jgi:hypothetical protein